MLNCAQRSIEALLPVTFIFSRIYSDERTRLFVISWPLNIFGRRRHDLLTFGQSQIANRYEKNRRRILNRTLDIEYGLCTTLCQEVALTQDERYFAVVNTVVPYYLILWKNFNTWKIHRSSLLWYELISYIFESEWKENIMKKICWKRVMDRDYLITMISFYKW